jgi:hypothetical protein
MRSFVRTLVAPILQFDEPQRAPRAFQAQLRVFATALLNG